MCVPLTIPTVILDESYGVPSSGGVFPTGILRVMRGRKTQFIGSSDALCRWPINVCTYDDNGRGGMPQEKKSEFVQGLSRRPCSFRRQRWLENATPAERTEFLTSLRATYVPGYLDLLSGASCRAQNKLSSSTSCGFTAHQASVGEVVRKMMRHDKIG